MKVNPVALLILIMSAAILRADDTIPAVFYLHQKTTVKSTDSLVAPSLTDGRGQAPPLQVGSMTNDDHGNLTISGYKSFGVSIGELGEVNLEQGLEAVIEGEIRPGTMLRAQLSDQGSSIDGSTREISDFDMMFVELANEKFSITAGDQFAAWQDGGILSGQKKIVGISGAVTPMGGRASVSAFGSFSGGNHTAQTLRGREGVQGPYYLTGRGEANIITPVDGTVKVRVNGNELAEGIDGDFTVDYDIGAVTFNPRVLICRDDFIRVEYEYKAFDYRRTFVGSGASYLAKDSVFSIRGTLWSESDDRDNPIEMQLSEREKEILRSSGKNPAYASSTARPVHPLDVARISVFHPLYKKVYDDGAQDTILIFTPYDPLRPEDTRDFYTAAFTSIEAGITGADYVIDTTVERGQFVYKYAGAGNGNFTAFAPIAAPMRETAGEMVVKLRLPFAGASLNIAGKEVNRNLFSNLSDGSDLSSAIMFKLNAGEKRADKRSVHADVDYRYRSRKFTSEIFSADERRDGWGADGVEDAADGHDFQSWESTVGGTVVKGVSISAGAGQTFVDSLVETEKAAADARLRFVDEKFGVDLGAAVFRHYLSDIDISHRRHGKFTAKPSKSWETFVDYKDEWRVDTLGQGGGRLSGTVEGAYTSRATARVAPTDTASPVGAGFTPAHLRQNINVTQYRRGENFPGSVDTGYAVTWNQSAALSPAKSWRLAGDSRWRHTKINGQGSASTFLMSTTSEIEQTRAGFSSRQEYRVNQEIASRFEQKMFFIGKGLGTHAFDSTAGEFRPAINGDHIIQEVEIYDNTSSATVRKTMLSGDWYFRPARKISGFLGDMSWSGVLSLEEHVDSRNNMIISYIPGLLSLFPDDNDASEPSSTTHINRANYSDLSYRQDINYQVQDSPWRARLYFLPGMKIIRGYKEPTFETALLTERKKNRLTLSAEPKYLSISRESLSGAFHGKEQNGIDKNDISAEFVQSVQLKNTFEFYVRERAGRIYDNDPARAASIPLDSSLYLQIKPGIVHKPARGGVAELAYTFSYTPYTGELDYRMAGGSPRGTSHAITLFGDINTGKHFNMSGLYRGELTRGPGETAYSPMLHVFSFQIKAFL